MGSVRSVLPCGQRWWLVLCLSACRGIIGIDGQHDSGLGNPGAAESPHLDARSGGPLQDSATGPLADANAQENDGGVDRDTGAALIDAGSPPRDAGSPPRDAGSPPRDAGSPPRDAGIPAMDAGSPPGDSGSRDSGPRDSGPRDSGPRDSGPRDSGPTVPSGTWPTANTYSWHGRWSPSFPISGLYDNEYFDGHRMRDGTTSPILPPGAWDWNDSNNDTANWRNFEAHIGSFATLTDSTSRVFGWQLVPITPAAVEYTGAAAYFEGSQGSDRMDLGPDGNISSFGSGNLRDGPDVLVFNTSWSLHFMTGSVAAGYASDDDLVIGGCDNSPDGSWDITTTTIHTGPGADWAFVRDIARAGVDLGNPNGVTSSIDPHDGDDLLVLRGNTYDFRATGGGGNDTIVWYVDDNVQTTTWLGPNFFGGGGWGDANWGDTGTDRLVLAVPPTTTIVTRTPTPMGGLLVKATTGALVDDAPTADDPLAHYCVECGTGPGGRKTVILEYRSITGAVFTGYFYVTAFEELQLGVGSSARVFRINDVAGTLAEDTSLTPFSPPTPPADYCR